MIDCILYTATYTVPLYKYKIIAFNFAFASRLIWSFDTDTVNFTVNSSQEYACLGEIYKMNCTSTEPFNRCNISTPCWFKDSKPFTKACFNNNCKSYDSQTEELSVHVPHNDSTAHIYVCGARRKPRRGCPHSNRFTVKPLSKLEGTAQCIAMHPHNARTQCQGSI